MRPEHAHRIALAASLALVTYAFVMNAWVSEDAYISFRTVENFTTGHGLTWNPGERVQAYTHPLWVLLMSAAHAVTREVYLTSIVLSWLSVVVAVVVCWRATGVKVFALCLLAVGSKAFVDYSSSGLENALGYAIAALFFTRLVHRGHDGLAGPFLLGSLAFVTRQDTILLYAPALAWILVRGWRGRGRGVILPLLAGLSPALAWEAFSIFYYGFPFPNSAYAKLGTGIDALDLAAQGLRYFANSFRWDPLTLPAIAAGAIWAATRGTWAMRSIAAGIVLYLLYVVRIGGDFMSGRFFALPFFVALVALASIPLRRSGWLAAGAVAALALAAPAAPLKTTRGYTSLGIDAHGIADERGYYFRSAGLLFYRSGPFPDHPGMRAGRELREAENRGAVTRMVGYFGFAAGPDKVVVDVFGIGDPLLARLPVEDPEHWRIGHFRRTLPDGYAASILSGENRLEDPELRAFYDKLRLVVAAPLLAPGRLRAIVELNAGVRD